MSSHSVIYCDESGNDGPNYLNPANPFYVLGGWIAPDEAIVEATLEIEQLRQTYSQGADEIKSATFKRKSNVVCDSMEKLGRIGLTPIYILAEKRFCIAAKIVETFLDPFYNPRLNQAFTHELPAKQELANTIYERLDDRALSEFAQAYRNPTQTGLEQALHTVAAQSFSKINPELAELLQGCLPNISDIAHSELEAVSTWGRSMGTLNFPCLITFLMMVEQLGRQGFTRPQRIVHDEQGPYQDDYIRAFEMYRGANDDERWFLEGMHVPHGAIRNIEVFEIQESVRQPMLQAADLLAGSLTNIASKLVRGDGLRDEEIRLGGLLFPPLYFKDIITAFPLCSSEMLSKFTSVVATAFKDSMPESEPDEDPYPNFGWISTVPDGEHLPVLPAKKVAEPKDVVPHVSLKFDLPLFSLVDVAEDRMVVLNGNSDKPFHLATRQEKGVLLWTDKKLAEDFLARQEWEEPHKVIEFGPKELPDLIERLRQLSEFADMIWFNLGGSGSGPAPILNVADTFERILDRIVRTHRSGLSGTIYKTQTIGGREITSLLLADGEYGASYGLDGPIGRGATREEAVQELLKQIGLDES